MKRPYLNGKLKRYYQEQLSRFRELELAPEDLRAFGGWLYDHRLDESLEAINQYADLQTMLSRFPRGPLDAAAAPGYLQVAFSRDVKSEFYKALKRVRDEAHPKAIVWWRRAKGDAGASAEDLPAPLRELDALTRQKSYVNVHHALIFFCPVEGLRRSAEDMLQVYNDVYDALVSALCDVGKSACQFVTA